MIYITGDCHFDFKKVEDFCNNKNTTKEDVLIVLGDACVNYYRDARDVRLKKKLSKLPITFFFVYGNHEIRPEDIPDYNLVNWNDNMVYEEERFPSLKFAVDGDIYIFNDKKFLVIGGAYSVDKYYRLGNGLLWAPNEQPSKEIFNKAYKNLKDCKNDVDFILTHTCPFGYMPKDRKCTDIDPKTIDTRTERELRKIMNATKFQTWYCGHFHVDRKIGKVAFMHKRIQEV